MHPVHNQWKYHKAYENNFQSKIKLEAAQLVVEQGCFVVEAAKAMNVSKSAMDKWVRQIKQEIQGITPKQQR